ncbi:MAG: serine/threonine protein kinase [Polyangiales bacterium]
MSTEDFFSLTPDRVLSAVEALGVRCTGLCYPLNSLENRVYEIEREDRSRVVAKFYRPGRWSVDAVRDEHTFLADLAAAEIPVAAPIALPDGATARYVEGTSILCALFPRVGGRVPDECTEEQLRRLGGLLARIHTVGASRAAPHRVSLTVARYGRESLATLLAAPTLPPTLAPRLKAVSEALFARIGPWFEDLDVHRIHGDCHPGNLLWGTAGPFFLDFDDMLTGPPVQDLWMLVPAYDEEGAHRRDVVLEGYEVFRAFDRSTLRLVEPLRAALPPLRRVGHATLARPRVPAGLSALRRGAVLVGAHRRHRRAARARRGRRRRFADARAETRGDGRARALV